MNAQSGHTTGSEDDDDTTFYTTKNDNNSDSSTDSTREGRKSLDSLCLVLHMNDTYNSCANRSFRFEASDAIRTLLIRYLYARK